MPICMALRHIPSPRLPRPLHFFAPLCTNYSLPSPALPCPPLPSPAVPRPPCDCIILKPHLSPHSPQPQPFRLSSLPPPLSLSLPPEPFPHPSHRMAALFVGGTRPMASRGLSEDETPAWLSPSDRGSRCPAPSDGCRAGPWTALPCPGDQDSLACVEYSRLNCVML